MTGEQVLRLQEDKAFPYGQAATDFGYAPLVFRERVDRQIELEFGMPAAGRRAAVAGVVAPRRARG